MSTLAGRGLVRAAVVFASLAGCALGCSVLNRSGPDVTCAELGDGAENACADGIIATCRDGAVHWTVCDDKSACDAAWQTPGEYRCAETDPAGEASTGTGGSGGAGGGTGGAAASGTGGHAASGGSAVGGQSGTDCDSCVSARCSVQLSNCLGDSKCTSLYQCIDGCTDTTCSSSCVSQYPSYDFGQPLRQCVSDNCSKECPLWR